MPYNFDTIDERRLADDSFVGQHTRASENVYCPTCENMKDMKRIGVIKSGKANTGIVYRCPDPCYQLLLATFYEE